jgi:hypothetical protein
MWFFIFVIVLFVLALGGGRWGYPRYAYWSWSPAAVILVVGLVLFFTGHIGCSSSDAKATAEWEKGATAAVKLEKAEVETKEAAKASQDYAYARKAEFVAKMKKDLADIQAEIDRLSARVDKSSGAAKADAKTRLEAVRQSWAQARKRLDEAEGATESTWDDVKGGVRKSYGEVKDSFEKTRDWMSGKIEA